MDITAIRGLALDAALAGVGVAAVVTPLGGAAVETRGIWAQPVTELMPVGHEFQRREPRRIMAFATRDVPALPRGSTIVAVPPGGTTTRTWIVDGVDQNDGDQIRVVVKASGG